MRPVNPLQKLITDRLAELEISQRAAAARSQGLVTTATLNRIVNGHHTAITARVAAGIALALDVPEARVNELARQTANPTQWTNAAKKFPALSPARQDKVMKALLDAIAENEAEQRKRIEKERPHRYRKAR